MSLTKAERTTTINMDDSSDEAIVVTYQKPWMRMLDDNPEAELINELSMGGREYRIPARLIKPRKPRAMSEEGKAAAGERLKNARQMRGRRAGLL